MTSACSVPACHRYCRPTHYVNTRKPAWFAPTAAWTASWRAMLPISRVLLSIALLVGAKFRDSSTKTSTAFLSVEIWPRANERPDFSRPASTVSCSLTTDPILHVRFELVPRKWTSRSFVV
jgi:hypothetical protein